MKELSFYERILNDNWFYKSFRDEYIEEISEKLSKRYDLPIDDIKRKVEYVYSDFVEGRGYKYLIKARLKGLDAIDSYLKDFNLIEPDKDFGQFLNKVVEDPEIKDVFTKDELRNRLAYIYSNELYEELYALLSEEVEVEAEKQVAYDYIKSRVDKDSLMLFHKLDLFNDPFDTIRLAEAIKEDKLKEYFLDLYEITKRRLDRLETLLEQLNKPDKGPEP